MFPGYATCYKDKNNKVHLYFFPGIDDKGKHIYKDLDLSTEIEHTVNKYSDSAKEYIFENKNIAKIVCKLLGNDGKYNIIELTV